MDCTSKLGGELCNQFGIRGYPTIKLLKENKFYTFNDRRNIEAIT